MPLSHDYTPSVGDLLFWTRNNDSESEFNLIIKIAPTSWSSDIHKFTTINEEKEIEILRIFKDDMWTLISKGPDA